MSNLSVMHFERLYTLDSMKRASILKSLEISFAVAIETGEKKQLLSPLPPNVPTIGLRDQNGTAYVEAISRSHLRPHLTRSYPVGCLRL